MKKHPGMDKIITNTNNRCRTLFKCQIESGDWGKYNLIIMLQNSATFMAGFGLHKILPFYYSAGNTITFVPCILEEEHFLIQQVTPQKYCHWWSSLLWCDSVSLVECFLTFCRKARLPSFSFKTFRKHSPNNKASHPRWYQSLAKPMGEPQISQ